MTIAISRAPDAAVRHESAAEPHENLFVGAGLGFAGGLLAIFVICSVDPCMY